VADRPAKDGSTQPPYIEFLDDPAITAKGRPTVNERDRQRKRALIIFQIFIYGYLLLMFGIQLSMWATRNW
jgi:hypothetical protein